MTERKAATGTKTGAALNSSYATPILLEANLSVTPARTYIDGPRHVGFWIGRLIDGALTNQAQTVGGDDAH